MPISIKLEEKQKGAVTMPKISTEQVKEINIKCSNRLEIRFRILPISWRKTTHEMYRPRRRKLPKIYIML